jgi:hypothetical protein
MATSPVKSNALGGAMLNVTTDSQQQGTNQSFGTLFDPVHIFNRPLMNMVRCFLVQRHRQYYGSIPADVHCPAKQYPRQLSIQVSKPHLTICPKVLEGYKWIICFEKYWNRANEFLSIDSALLNSIDPTWIRIKRNKLRGRLNLSMRHPLTKSLPNHPMFVV